MGTQQMKDQLRVIGVVGHARAGKDTVAKILGANHGYHRIALADGIREAFASLSGPAWDLHKDLTDDFNIRRAMQILGTECREEMDNYTMWIDVALSKIHYAERYHPRRIDRFVIPDIRYPREAERIKATVQDWGGKFEAWRVRRNTPRIAESSHSSEKHIDEIPVAADLCNDGTIGFLALQVNALLSEDGRR